MNVFHQYVRTVLAAVLFLVVHSHAHASLILAQIIDENSPIRGLAYVDGILIQDDVLADETYADRFTGFAFIDPSSRPVDFFNVSYNIYSPDNQELVATLSLSGGPDFPLVHTFYYSTFPGAVLDPWESPTANLIADGAFHTVLQFTTDNGDEYVFQYKNLVAEVPEPATLLILMIGLLCMFVARRRPLCVLGIPDASPIRVFLASVRRPKAIATFRLRNQRQAPRPVLFQGFCGRLN